MGSEHACYPKTSRKDQDILKFNFGCTYIRTLYVAHEDMNRLKMFFFFTIQSCWHLIFYECK